MFAKMLVVASVLAATAALAVPPDLDGTAHPPAKGDAHVRQHLAFDREGGETIATAVPILALPFTDTGATCDNVNDYDEGCPYPSSYSPDVVYSLAPTFDWLVDIDLCGSAYDTKVYVYDEALSLIACNDDYYFDEDCGIYVSYLEQVPLAAGVTYYIVVDGYGSDCGEYVLHVEEGMDCVLAWPPFTVDENEPPLGENYVDYHNGGCSTNTFQELAPTDGESLAFHGTTGWYLSQGSNYRDTDWYLLTFGALGQIEIEADAEEPTFFFELGPMDCATVAVVQQMTAGPCLPAGMTITGTPGETVWFWAGPTVFVPPSGPAVQEYDFLVWFDGLQAVVATEATTWSGVKALYGR